MPITPEHLFQALADPTRLRSLVLLATAGELCVCELTHAVGEIQPKISRHLALLRDAGIVAGRRQGQWIYYRLNPELPDWARSIVGLAAEGAAGVQPFGQDRRRLERMPNRPGGARCA